VKTGSIRFVNTGGDAPRLEGKWYEGHLPELVCLCDRIACVLPIDAAVKAVRFVSRDILALRRAGRTRGAM
jgi:hypothetical protein